MIKKLSSIALMATISVIQDSGRVLGINENYISF